MKGIFASKKDKEVNKMKKGLVILMAVAMVFAFASIALAKGDISPSTYSLSGKDWGEKIQGNNTYTNGLGQTRTLVSSPAATNNSTHPYGTWNSPYTSGIDGYNYNDPQEYTTTGEQTGTASSISVFSVPYAFQGLLGSTTSTVETKYFQSGPHGGYKTSTHRCRECHAVHRAAGKFKLLRSDTRFEACDWCHGTGAGSGFNIQMDNDDQYTEEYNTGHTMGFGLSNGKWKAPDDTYPAFTPNYWLGGFSCFDCHSPHANPQRLMGYDENGKPIESIVRLSTGEVFNLGNPGHDMYLTGSGDSQKEYSEHANEGDWVVALGGPLPKSKPYYLAGSWLLVKNPDKEVAAETETAVRPDVYSYPKGGQWPGSSSPDMVLYGNHTLPNNGLTQDQFDPANHADTGTIVPGQEIPDSIDVALAQFSGRNADGSPKGTLYPVNKVPTDWNNPIGSASLWDFTNNFGMSPVNNNYGYNVRNPYCRSLILDEFCTDCHDGNGGLHTIAAPLFSEDRALRDQTTTSGTDSASSVTGDTTNWKGQYDIAFGHDANIRH